MGLRMPRTARSAQEEMGGARGRWSRYPELDSRRSGIGGRTRTSDEKKIVLFGLNPPAFLCKQRLEERGLPTFAYVDNSPSAIQWWYHPRVAPAHHCFRGQERIPACKPDELPGEFHEEYVFLLYSKFEREMLQQLEKLGYSRERQTFVVGGFWKTEERKRAVIPEGAATKPVAPAASTPAGNTRRD